MYVFYILDAHSGSGNDRDPIIQQIYQHVPAAAPTSMVINVYSPNDVNLTNIGGLLTSATRLEQLP